MSDKINIILNGKSVTGEKGESILQVANRNGIEIPTLCNDPRLDPYSSCYVCVVEIVGLRGLQPACSTRISEGMDIHTENEKVIAARKTALDLIVSNHYADCVAPCKETCPAGVDVQGYISLIEKGLYSEAVEVIKRTNPLPAICGRVCVRPCEAACRRNLLDEGTGVGIDYMKRFAADYDLEAENYYKPEVAPSTGKKVAIIGAGPGGLSAAWFLQQKGHQCDIYEASPNPGGWLRYGIPEYRLPNDIIDKETARITELGANIFYNKKLGENLKYAEIEKNYDASVLCIGSQRGTLLGCEGEDADGVFSGIDFLRNMEVTGQRYDFTGKKVVVVGGGNTAMDCCRTSLRCNSTDVKVVYRRTEKEMPANPIEIHESKLEGVEYLFLTNPVRVNKDENGKLKSMTLIKMGLGEPDASGRRRPVPIEGSEFDIEVDYILAAIGQKTVINFLDDVNGSTSKGELKPNRWGDIEADSKTLQTGVKNMFAAGDGVTGPATLIEAVGQARIASLSCHQYLMGEEVKPAAKEFISRKDNFKEQTKDEYVVRYQNQLREEMPTLDPNSRVNFDEVELGYTSEAVTQKETARCLECGCVEYFSCDLKRLCDKYGAEQKRFEGEFREYSVDFSHPYIEIDSNKCVLCSRCVRICKDVVGASALGLVNRGFETYVAPALGDSLKEGTCESCGMCISTCPTGAITENVIFKPGPVKMDAVETICSYCSVGCAIELHHKSGFVMKTTGKEGLVNADGNICRYPRFGYNVLNDGNRIKKPLLKVNGKYEEISFEKAAQIIKEKIQGVKSSENAFFAGARLSNEEIYMVQKLARTAAGTNNVNSFHYLFGGTGYDTAAVANVPFEQLKRANKIVLFGSEVNRDNAVAGFMINASGAEIELVTNNSESTLNHKYKNVNHIKSYYHFIKAVNHYLVSKGLQNSMYINDNTEGFQEYKNQILAESYSELCEKACGCHGSCIEKFATEFNNEMNAVLVYSEKEVSPQTSMEIQNLAMITGKLGKIASGIICLKEKNNSQGLFDMGARPYTSVGNQLLTDEKFASRLAKVWKINSLPEPNSECMSTSFLAGKYKNMFVFGEDPVGCAFDKEEVQKVFKNASFVLVQDYFMTETAKEADLVLPATFGIETDGSFTNTQGVIQEFTKQFASKVEKTGLQQLSLIMEQFGLEGQSGANEVRAEAMSLLPEPGKVKYSFESTVEKGYKKVFASGCDYIVKYFDDAFSASFAN